MTTKFESTVTPAGMVDLGQGASAYLHRPVLHATWTFEDGTVVSVREQTDRTYYPKPVGRFPQRPYVENVRASKSRVYVSACETRGETVLDDLQNRRSRPHTAWKPRVAEALDRIGYQYDKLAWRQRAGCSCGCSPAFVVEGQWESLPLDVYVTLP